MGEQSFGCACVGGGVRTGRAMQGERWRAPSGWLVLALCLTFFAVGGAEEGVSDDDKAMGRIGEALQQLNTAAQLVGAHKTGGGLILGGGSEIGWDYGDNSMGLPPKSWGQINDVCVSGKRQSPVNIVSKATTKGSGDKHTKMQFAYRPTAGSIRNDGKSMYVDVSTNIRNEVVADGSHFQLTQYRFHSPSEHKIDGREYPVEMQMIHRNKAGKIVIVSVLFVTTDSAADHPFLVPLWKKMPGFGSMSGAVIDHVSPQAGMPRGQKFYSYSGSLTTPPCKEKVLWVVMKEAGVISFNQILKLRDALRLDYKESVRNGNARPVMPAGKRLIYKNSISKDDLKDVSKGCTQSADPGGKLAKEKLRKAKAITEKTQKLEKRSRGLEKKEKEWVGTSLACKDSQRRKRPRKQKRRQTLQVPRKLLRLHRRRGKHHNWQLK